MRITTDLCTTGQWTSSSISGSSRNYSAMYMNTIEPCIDFFLNDLPRLCFIPFFWEDDLSVHGMMGSWNQELVICMFLKHLRQNETYFRVLTMTGRSSPWGKPPALLISLDFSLPPSVCLSLQHGALMGKLSSELTMERLQCFFLMR